MKSYPPPAISIQLPVYNKALYLRECLDSIIDQTFTDFEAVCVDDGSTDGSWDILREYAARDARFRLFRHETNQGTLSARKLCFMEARGGHMAFIDADDLAEPGMLAQLYSMAREGIDFVQCAARLYNPENILSSERAGNYDRALQAVLFSRLDGRDAILRGLGISIKSNLWLSLVSRGVYRSILPYIPAEQIPHGNDNLLILMLAFFAGTYRNTDLALYRVRANLTSSNFTAINPEKVLEHIESRGTALGCCIDFLRRFESFTDWRSHICAYFLNLLRIYPARLIGRCIAEYPDSRDSLHAAYVRAFRDNMIDSA